MDVVDPASSRATPGFAGGSWPHEMTLAENLGDLGIAARHFAEGSGLTYSVLDPGDGDVIGCVYIYPLRSTGDGDARKPIAGAVSVLSGCARACGARRSSLAGGHRLARGGLAVRAHRLRASRLTGLLGARLAAYPRRRARVRSVDHGTALLPQAGDPAAGGRGARRDRPARWVEVTRRASGHGGVVVHRPQRARRARDARAADPPADAAGRVPTEQGYRVYAEQLVEAIDGRPDPVAFDVATVRSELEQPCGRRPRRSRRRPGSSRSSPRPRSALPRCGMSTCSSCNRAPSSSS